MLGYYSEMLKGRAKRKARLEAKANGESWDKTEPTYDENGKACARHLP